MRASESYRRMYPLDIDRRVQLLALPPSTGTYRKPQRDLDLDQVRIRGEAGEVADVKRSTASCELSLTIEGASTLTIKVADTDDKLLKSTISQKASTVVLDGVEYTLAKVSYAGDDLTMIFEESAVNVMRKYTSPKKANRESTTRAQFIKGMVKEVKERTIPFYCPEVDERQPVAAAKKKK